MMSEVWKPISPYTDYYISNYGNVRSTKTGKPVLLKTHSLKNGYKYIDLYENATRKKYLVHRLVGQYFVDNPYDKPFINHIDENKGNNRSDNLEWCTRLENNRYGTGQYRAKIARQGNKHYFKPIIQLSTNDEIIQEWTSIKEASEKTGIGRTCISQTLIGRAKTAGGFKWRYKNG